MQNIFIVLVPYWQDLSQSYYGSMRSSLSRVYYDLMLERRIIYRVNSDSDITIINNNFLPVHDQLYQIDFNLTRNGLINITITNNTFKNLYFHLDNSKSTMNIEENVFIGSGIKIIEEANDSAVSTIIENNIFQGLYVGPVIELWNVRNVILKQNYFQNLQMIKPYLDYAKLSVGILCTNSIFGLSYSSFNNVTLKRFIQLDYCSVEMDNVRFFKNALDYGYSTVRMEKSNGTFSNIIFADNFQCDGFSVWKGELLLQNVSFSGNNHGLLATVFVSNIVLINVTAETNRGIVMKVRESSVKISLCRWQENSGDEDLVHVSDSWMEINNSLFEKNYFQTMFDFLRVTAEFVNCNFTWNKAKLILNEISSEETELKIRSCRFEENMRNENSLIDVDAAFVKLQDTIFLNTINGTENGMINVRSVRASFNNCTAINKDTVYSFGFLLFLESSANISNCKFSGYRFGDLEKSNISIENTLLEGGGAIRAYSSSTVVVINATFDENRSIGSDGGAIFIADKSKLVSDNCTFSGNTAVMDGGAVMVTDSSTYRDTGSLFFNNTAPNYGKLKYGLMLVNGIVEIQYLSPTIFASLRISFKNMNKSICTFNKQYYSFLVLVL